MTYTSTSQYYLTTRELQPIPTLVSDAYIATREGQRSSLRCNTCVRNAERWAGLHMLAGARRDIRTYRCH